MTDTFDVEQLPFSLLNDSERILLLENIERREYQPLDILIAAGEPSQGVFVLLKGRVAESECSTQSSEQLVQQQTAFMHYEAGEYFGSWSVFNGHAIHNFIAVETTLCHLIPTQILLE